MKLICEELEVFMKFFEITIQDRITHNFLQRDFLETISLILKALYLKLYGSERFSNWNGDWSANFRCVGGTRVDFERRMLKKGNYDLSLVLEIKKSRKLVGKYSKCAQNKSDAVTIGHSKNGHTVVIIGQ